MNYQQYLGENGEAVIVDDIQDLSYRHAIKAGAHDAVSDAVKYAALGAMAIAVVSMLPRSWINKVKREMRSIL